MLPGDAGAVGGGAGAQAGSTVPGLSFIQMMKSFLNLS